MGARELVCAMAFHLISGDQTKGNVAGYDSERGLLLISSPPC